MPGHAEVEQQPRPALETGDEVFPGPVETLDPLALEGSAQRLGRREEEVALGRRLDALDPVADEQRGDATSGRLDFGELGHRGGFVSQGLRASSEDPLGIKRCLDGLIERRGVPIW